MIVGRHRAQVRLRHLDVVAEDAVVADLERRDAGSRALALFHLRDHLLARTADRPQLVELPIDAVAREAAVAREHRRVFGQRRFNRAADVREVVELGDERSHERRLQLAEHRAHPRHDAERLPEADEVAWSGGAEGGTRDEPLEVLNGFQRLAEPAAIGRTERQLLDGVEPMADRFECDEWTKQPRAQKSAADRRHRRIDLPEQRSVAAALGSFQHLEMLQRRRIDEQRIRALPEGNRPDVRQVDLLRAAEMVDERACGRDGGVVAVETESSEAAGAELIEQRSSRGLHVERPGVDGGNRQPCGDDRIRERMRGPAVGRARSVVTRRENFARPDDRELVGQRLQSLAAGVFGRSEFAGREIEQRDAHNGWRGAFSPAIAALKGPRHIHIRWRHRHDERRLARVEVPRVGQRPRRDDADDFALDDALRLARIFDLLADGDAESFLDEPRDVAVDGVVRHAAHRDAAAVRVLRPRRQRQFERPRRHEGVFVEHLVEVAHPEQQDRIAMLLLRVQVLTHRGRRRR